MGKPSAFPGQVPKGDFEAAERGNVLAALGAREDAGPPQFLPDSLHIQGVLADQARPEAANQRRRAHGGVRRFALANKTLVRVDSDVRLRSMHGHHGGAHVGDFQPRTVIGRRGALDGGGKVRQPQPPGQGRSTRRQEVPARFNGHRQNPQLNPRRRHSCATGNPMSGAPHFWLAQTPFCGVCDAPQGHGMDRPAPLPHRPTGPFGKSQTPQNGVCASHGNRIFDPAFPAGPPVTGARGYQFWREKQPCFASCLYRFEVSLFSQHQFGSAKGGQR